MTSGKPVKRSHILHNTAAQLWLNAAPGPQAKTAAAARASGFTGRCPTAYTPR